MSLAKQLIESYMAEVDSKFLSAVKALASKYHGQVQASKADGVSVKFPSPTTAEGFWNVMADEFADTFPNATPQEVPGDASSVYVKA